MQSTPTGRDHCGHGPSPLSIPSPLSGRITSPLTYHLSPDISHKTLLIINFSNNFTSNRNFMKKSSVILTILAVSALQTGAVTKITPGSPWADTTGKHINAHGGCVVVHDGTYYWFGEDRTGMTSNGVSCYSSADLLNWQRKGLVMKTSDANDPVTGKCILERPKVIFNDATGKWVMYSHWEDGTGYGEARVCVAVADQVDGEYQFVDTFRPNSHDSRDQTIFKDSDGKAYHFCATDMNTNINVALLSPDYLSTEQNPVTETKILNGLRLEAPAIIRTGDTYFGVFSGCSGWDPNPGHTAMATEILGYWTPGGNFCTDDGAETTYRSQSTFILKVPGHDNSYIYMGDRWNTSDIGGKSEYVWLPLSLRSGYPTVQWRDSWDPSVFDDCDRFLRLANPTDGAVVRILDKFSDRWLSTTGNGFFIDNDNEETNVSLRMEATYNPYVWRFVDMKTGKYLQSVFGALSFAEKSDIVGQKWYLELQEDGTYLIQSMHDRKTLTVAGSSQRAGTQLFMTTPGATEAQYFGLYFDSYEYDYEAAALFSAAYREENLLKMEAQENYDDTGIESALISPFGIRMAGNDMQIVSPERTEAVIRITSLSSGIDVVTVKAVLETGANSVCPAATLPAGIYAAMVTSPLGQSTRKIILP